MYIIRVNSLYDLLLTRNGYGYQRSKDQIVDQQLAHHQLLITILRYL